MSHFSLLVITPTRPTKAKLNELLAPYSEELKTEERFEAMDGKSLERMAKHYGFDPADKKAAVENMEDWTGAAGVLRDDGVVGHLTTYNENSKWDWWQLGGRWSGHLDPTYDPEKDPRNTETCEVCKGTGRRDDQLGREARLRDPTYGCNGCEGKGRRVKWPTQWVSDVGNQARVGDLPDGVDLNFYAYLRDGRWIENSNRMWDAANDEKAASEWDEQRKSITASLQPDEWLTVIDCHI